MTDTVKLTHYVKESGLKQEFIARKIGLSSYGFARKRDNKTEFLPSEIDKLCEILHIDSLEERFAIFFANGVELNTTDSAGEGVLDDGTRK